MYVTSLIWCRQELLWIIKGLGSLEQAYNTTCQPTSMSNLAWELRAFPKAQNLEKTITPLHILYILHDVIYIFHIWWIIHTHPPHTHTTNLILHPCVVWFFGYSLFLLLAWKLITKKLVWKDILKLNVVWNKWLPMVASSSIIEFLIHCNPN